ncbi:MAG: hypothetical protein COB46_03225 [Rhodospirillaceae bacterium]|nr:MAG: hypothetical protein COB46_03225 [Rhodospirillaceae bacterium]
MIKTHHLSRALGIAGIAVIAMTFTACTQVSPNQSRMGMVIDEKTGLLFGSAIDGNLITDASFYTNRSLKVRTRNTSGDTTFNLSDFTQDLVAAYEAKGYEPTQKDGFGLLMDINVLYSGQAQSTQSTQLGIIGALMGSTYGGATQKGNILASITGATLGHILGSYITDDTYMVVAEVTFGVVKKYRISKKRVTFSRSKKLANIDDPDWDEKVYARGFKETFTTQFTVYAGGRNVKQSEIADEVRKRAVRIAADYI